MESKKALAGGYSGTAKIKAMKHADTHNLLLVPQKLLILSLKIQELGDMRLMSLQHSKGSCSKMITTCVSASLIKVWNLELTNSDSAQWEDPNLPSVGGIRTSSVSLLIVD